MKQVIRVGSRESALAVAQANVIRSQIKQAHPEIKTELVTMKTTGDRILDRSLESAGGKGLFVKELDQALLDGTIDIAVHSLKDMPADLQEDLPILAYGKRDDPRDVLIYKPGQNTFPENGVLGTSSQRRAVQMQKLFPSCSFRGIRGNVQTRLRKLKEEPYDGTILAAAGLRRLGIEAVIGRIFEVEEMVPAAGQGILAVQGRRGESFLSLDCVKSVQSKWEALAERQFIRALDAGCTSPMAAHAQATQTEIKLTGLYYREADGFWWTDTVTGAAGRAEWLGEQLAKKMRQTG